MKKLKLVTLAVGLTIGLIAPLLYQPVALANQTPPAGTTPPTPCVGVDCIGEGGNLAGQGGANTDVPSFIVTLVNTLLFIVGALSVVMIIVGGVQYTSSAGDPAKVTKENTVTYAVVGLAISILAFAIVGFVNSQLTSNSANQNPGGGYPTNPTNPTTP